MFERRSRDRDEILALRLDGVQIFDGSIRLRRRGARGRDFLTHRDLPDKDSIRGLLLEGMDSADWPQFEIAVDATMEPISGDPPWTPLDTPGQSLDLPGADFPGVELEEFAAQVCPGANPWGTPGIPDDFQLPHYDNVTKGGSPPRPFIPMPSSPPPPQPTTTAARTTPLRLREARYLEADVRDLEDLLNDGAVLWRTFARIGGSEAFSNGQKVCALVCFAFAPSSSSPAERHGIRLGGSRRLAKLQRLKEKYESFLSQQLTGSDKARAVSHLASNMIYFPVYNA
ncbi:hypothetical protein DFP72DRAFT_844138 [Ephemerocybe angulata]|uniref:Uncharacterized protein n=1 Tax=Ephemerocybe angulata TaxID=980116 RepID=A0A8H6MCU7_9AGAR|nr:hypothetical protein DFP72DRAFT_844138 [Tulosesus angulatus]